MPVAILTDDIYAVRLRLKRTVESGGIYSPRNRTNSLSSTSRASMVYFYSIVQGYWYNTPIISTEILIPGFLLHAEFYSIKG